MTFVFIILRRKYDSSQDFEIDNKEYSNKREKVFNNLFMNISKQLFAFVYYVKQWLKGSW